MLLKTNLPDRRINFQSHDRQGRSVVGRSKYVARLVAIGRDMFKPTVLGLDMARGDLEQLLDWDLEVYRTKIAEYWFNQFYVCLEDSGCESLSDVGNTQFWDNRARAFTSWCRIAEGTRVARLYAPAE